MTTHNALITRPGLPNQPKYHTWCQCGWEHEADTWFAATTAKQQHNESQTQ